MAIMDFELTILSWHMTGNIIFVCDDKVAKRTIFWAIPMAPTYQSDSILVVGKVWCLGTTMTIVCG